MFVLLPRLDTISAKIVVVLWVGTQHRASHHGWVCEILHAEPVENNKLYSRFSAVPSLAVFMSSVAPNYFKLINPETNNDGTTCIDTVIHFGFPSPGRKAGC